MTFIGIYGVWQLINQDEIHKQCLSKDLNENLEALKQLKTNFSLMPDKIKAWKDLIQLTSSKYWNVKYLAAYVLDFVFSEVPNKKQSWNDLHRLTNDKDVDIRKYAADAFKSSFSEVPDKQQAWKDLIALATDKDKYIRIWFSYVLSSVFSEVPDKHQAWKDLIALTNDQNSVVRSRVASALASVFSHMPDKQQAWKDLISIINDKKSFVRSRIAFILVSIFLQVPNKQQAWNDLYKLTTNKKNPVRFYVTSVLASVFFEMPDKQQAWNDLYKLIIDENYYDISDNDRYVIPNTIDTLVSYFSELPDKQQAWNELYKLATDKHKFVRIYANHSLGKISIYRAAQAEQNEDYKKELEKAIEFFEKAAKESPVFWSSPSQFCLPFYRSFHTIIFKKQDTKEEIDKYLKAAKYAVMGSKNKRFLFRAVEDLANALQEVQSLENLDLEAKKCELNFYRKYCDHATELMKNTEEAAPYATAAMRKGLPILDKNLKGLIEEIQKKTEAIREQTRGTEFEQLGNELDNSSQFLLQVRDPVGFKKQVNAMQNTLKAICSKFPEGQKGEACELLKMMDVEPSIEDKIPLMVNILGKFSYQLDMTAQLNRIEEKLDQKLSCISYDIFKIKLNSYNVISNLDAMRKELKKLNEIEDLNESLMEKLEYFQAEKLKDLNKNILERLEEIQILIAGLPNNEDAQKIIDSLHELKQSDSDMLLQRSSAVISLIGFVMQVLPQILVHKQV